MIKAENMYLSFGLEDIYDDVSFQILNKDKVGIVGVNGAGKTTFFRLLLNEISLDRGSLIINEKHIGYLPQEISLPDLDISVYDYLLEVRNINKLKEELDKAYIELVDSSNSDILLKKISKINDELDYFNQYGYEEDLMSLIDEMHIDIDMLDRKLNTLSGGQKSKIAFARVLYAKPEILLLDEPTNHLDKETKAFIISYIKKFHGTTLIISHDIDFLNETIDKVLFINKVTHKAKIYIGDYTNFKRRYAEEMMIKEMRIEQQEREIAKLQEFVKRAQDASRTQHKLKTAGKAKEKLLNKKLENLEVRDKEYKHVKMKINPLSNSGKVPLEVSGLSFHYPNGDELYDDLSFSLTKNERFLIVGENGIGKSTLLKLIMNQLTPVTGTIKFSSKTSVSYYAQELEILNQNKNVIDNLMDGRFSERELRSYLGNFLFKGDDVYKNVSKLSPGEKARLALCKILLEKRNTIILDEPTNHFDPDTQSIIGENFKDFNGTLIVVSHNPKFVEEIGITRMLVLPSGKIMEYTPELLHYYYYLNTDL